MDGLCQAAMPLALLLTALLWAQWPLRDVVGAGAVQANDLAQVVFAWYVACAARHATARRAHLTARTDLAALPGRRTRLGEALCVLPWAIVVGGLSAEPVWQSLQHLERFPESFTEGYFLLRLAVPLLTLLMAAQALSALFGRRAAEDA